MKEQFPYENTDGIHAARMETLAVYHRVCRGASTITRRVQRADDEAALDAALARVAARQHAAATAKPTNPVTLDVALSRGLSVGQAMQVFDVDYATARGAAKKKVAA